MPQKPSIFVRERAPFLRRELIVEHLQRFGQRRPHQPPGRLGFGFDNLAHLAEKLDFLVGDDRRDGSFLQPVLVRSGADPFPVSVLRRQTRLPVVLVDSK
jgi:hypothetical protein